MLAGATCRSEQQAERGVIERGEPVEIDDDPPAYVVLDEALEHPHQVGQCGDVGVAVHLEDGDTSEYRSPATELHAGGHYGGSSAMVTCADSVTSGISAPMRAMSACCT